MKNKIPPPLSVLEQAAECLKVLGHPIRLQILFLINSQEHTVGNLAEQCNIKNNVASEHLKLMQRCGFLESRKEGTQVFYSISENHVLDLLSCIEKKVTSSK